MGSTHGIIILLHLSASGEHRGEYTAPAMLADFDILLTDALVRLSYHLMFGKVDPERLDPSWNMSPRHQWRGARRHHPAGTRLRLALSSH